MKTMSMLLLPAVLLPSVSCLLAQPTNSTQTVAEKLCAAYESIRTVSCEIRKTTDDSDHPPVRLLSRIYYQKPDRIHVDCVSPSRRRVVADGQKLYYHEKRVPRGFSRPIAQLTDKWLASLRNIPGTPYEQLVRLKGLPEQRLSAKPDYPVRLAYKADQMHVILSLDEQNRPALIEFLTDANATTKRAEYRYSDFSGPFDGCWFPNLHKGYVDVPDGNRVTETRRVSNLQVNQPIAQGLFSPHAFFKDVEFVDEFRKTYE